MEVYMGVKDPQGTTPPVMSVGIKQIRSAWLKEGYWE
jgi:hypothetical protein